MGIITVSVISVVVSSILGVGVVARVLAYAGVCRLGR